MKERQAFPSSYVCPLQKAARRRSWLTQTCANPYCGAVIKQTVKNTDFDIPEPLETVFIGWFNGGEVFRSGVTFRRGLGNVFYFQPGHEGNPTFHNENIQKVITNAVRWAAPATKKPEIICPCVEPLENV